MAKLVYHCYFTQAIYMEDLQLTHSLQCNELEACRSWQKALDTITAHNAKAPSSWYPRSETEKALRDSLYSMELQCKERIEILTALKLSREEKAAEDAAKQDGSSSNASSSNNGSGSKLVKPGLRSNDSLGNTGENGNAVQGFLGDGTIPAVSYKDLSRPEPITSRPSVPRNTSSTQAVLGLGRANSAGSSNSTYKMSNNGASGSREAALKAARNPGIGLDLPPLPPRRPSAQSERSRDESRRGWSRTGSKSRSPSPRKERTMLTTLRFGRGEKSRPKNPTSRGSGSSGKAADDAGSKAATLAWNALKRGGKPDNGYSRPLEIAASSAALESSRMNSSAPPSQRSSVDNPGTYHDSSSRRLVSGQKSNSAENVQRGELLPFTTQSGSTPASGETVKPQRPSSYPFPTVGPLQETSSAYGRNESAVLSQLTASLYNSHHSSPPLDQGTFKPSSDPETSSKLKRRPVPPPPPPGRFDSSTAASSSGAPPPPAYPTYLREYPETTARKERAQQQQQQAQQLEKQSMLPIRNRSPPKRERERVSYTRQAMANSSSPRRSRREDADESSASFDDRDRSERPRRPRRRPKQRTDEEYLLADADSSSKNKTPSDSEPDTDVPLTPGQAWQKKKKHLLKHPPPGLDPSAVSAILNDIIVTGDRVTWSDVAGLDAAKSALKEAVVYPFLRPDLFMGLREPARGILLFGPPGTGKTMLARAVATESKSTFFGVAAGSLMGKYLGESEKLVRALFGLARELAPSCIFVDEIDSLLGTRRGEEHEATRRVKTEFLIQWSDLQRAAAGREQTEEDKKRGDASRVLVLAATNMPWAIDDAARRRFVRRQYIPLPEAETRKVQLKNLLGHQKHNLSDADLDRLVELTDGTSFLLFPLPPPGGPIFPNLITNEPQVSQAAT